MSAIFLLDNHRQRRYFFVLSSKFITAVYTAPLKAVSITRQGECHMDQAVVTFTEHPLNAFCTQLIESAATYAASRFHYEVTVEHVLIKLLECHGGDSEYIFRTFKINTNELRQIALQAVAKLRVGSQGKPSFSALLTEWLDLAWNTNAAQYREMSMRSVALIDALVDMKNVIPFLMQSDVMINISLDKLRRDYRQILRSSCETSVVSISPSVQYDTDRTITNDQKLMLQSFTNFTKIIQLSATETIVGRQDELHELINILCQYHKNNPILIGDVGVGKSTLMRGLAAKINSGEIPADLRNRQLQLLDNRCLLGKQGNEKIQLITAVIEKVTAATMPSILVIDDVQELFDFLGDALVNDFLRLLINAVIEKKLRFIVTITPEIFRQKIKINAELMKYLVPLNIREPSKEIAVMMLNSQREQLQKHHNILITDDAIVTAVALADRYLPQKKLPEKALIVLDAACSRVRTSQVIAPSRIEAAKGNIAALEQRLENIYAELRNGIIGRENVLGELQTELDERNTELSILEQQWSREQEIVGHIQQNRSQLRTMQNTQNEAELLELKVATLLAQEELTELQGKQPMVRIEVDENTIAEVIGDWTGFSPEKIQQIAKQDNQQLLHRLTQKVIGQEKALMQIVQLLQTRPLLFTSSQAPLGAFLLAGPRGVGKSLTASVLAELLLGDQEFLLTIDFKAYQQIASVGLLRDKLMLLMKHRTYAVILCQEIEAAHPAVLQLIGDVINSGICNNDNGDSVSFKQCIFMLTTIIDNKDMSKINYLHDEKRDQLKNYLLQHFSAHLLASVQTIVYNNLSPAALAKITAHKLNLLAQRLQDSYQILFQYTPDVVDLIIAQMMPADFGALFIEQIIHQQLIPLLSEYLTDECRDEERTHRRNHAKILTIFVDDTECLACEWREIEQFDAYQPSNSFSV